MTTDKTITEDDVSRMAALSRLSISSEERTLFARQFQDILGYMDVLAHSDTDGIEPLYSPSEHAQTGREDCALRLSTRDATLANAPQQDGTYFVVPCIVQAG